MKYVMACQLDSDCVVEGGKHDEHDDHDDEEGGRKWWGLKIGLAAAFLVIGVVSALIPALFKNLPAFQVRLIVQLLYPLAFSSSILQCP